MILMPTAAGNFLSRLFNKAVIHDKKEDIPGRDPQRLEELMQGGLRDLLHSPSAFAQESSETGERPAQERTNKRLHHGGSVDFFPQLNETDNKGTEQFERRS
jgi:hypothetical protein